jgi:putative spermidine/putrescine transport system permease protein
VPRSLGAWIAILIGAIYFLVPLIGTFEFSMRMRRGEYSRSMPIGSVFSDPNFQATFGYSILLGLLTIVFGVLLVVPTAYWVRLRLPQLRPVMEFITLMPLVIPAIVIVFGYLRIYNSSSWLPFTGVDPRDRPAPDVRLYDVVAALYVSRCRHGDAHDRCRTLTEAAQSLGAGWGRRSCSRCIFPNVISGVHERRLHHLCHRHRRIHAWLRLLNRPAFGPYLQLVGANRAYEPSALAIISFAHHVAQHHHAAARLPLPEIQDNRRPEHSMAFLNHQKPEKELRRQYRRPGFQPRRRKRASSFLSSAHRAAARQPFCA